MQLRPYQRDAVEAAKAWCKTSIEPCLIDSPTGSGKSVLVASLAQWFNEISGGKRVLCLAPQKELTLQNAAKLRSIGVDCSIFSASTGIKSTRHKIVYGTPKTVSNSLSRFIKGDYCAILLDEAHTTSPTVVAIVEAMREANPNLRVVGCTATPYRLGSGYIYRMGPNGKVNGDDTCRDPFFAKCVFTICAKELIEQGYLTKPVIGSINSEAYDTSGLILRPNGKFDAASVDAAFIGHGRKTSLIVGDIVRQAQDRRGVVIFASTIKHAEEVLASLPSGLSAIITGECKDRAKKLKDFDEQKTKYLVNVGVLTTGWDCAHVDIVAFLRQSESVGLLQQCIGRGLRLYDGKKDCLILDYANNLDKHMPDGDLFAPVVKAGKIGGGFGAMEAHCPDCSTINEFSINGEYADMPKDAAGYVLDSFGEQIISEHGPVSGHYGRRCFGLVRSSRKGEFTRCNYRWNGKECPACGEQNDIAARRCYVCGSEIIDPNKVLAADFKAHKRDPHQVQTDTVISMETKEGISQRGNRTIRVDWKTDWRQFSVWFLPDCKGGKPLEDWRKFQDAREFGKPDTVSYVKDHDSGLFRILAYNMPADVEPAKVAA